MDVSQFIDKWARADRTERQAAQEHFNLCRVLGEPTPNEAADPGAYSFEKGASKFDGSPGFAIAAVSYALIESPCRNALRRWERRHAVTPLDSSVSDTPEPAIAR